MSRLRTREDIIVGLMAIGYAFSLRYIGGPSNPQLIFAALLLVGGCCYKFLPAFSGRPVQWGRPFTVLVAYLGWLILLMYTSTLPENSLHFTWLLATFALVTFLAADLESRSWFLALLLFSMTAMVSAIWGIGQFLVTSRRANGPVIDPSSWCAIINLFLFAAVYVLLTARDRRVRALALAGFAVFAMAALSAYSRVGNLVIFASTAFILAVCFRYRHLRSRLIVIVLILAAAYGGVHSRVGLDRATNDTEGYTLNFDVRGWHQRFAMWRGGWKIYLNHPLVGSGPGTFKVQYPKYRTQNDVYNLGNFVHNDYLEFLLEGGPLLLLFLLSLVGLLTVRLVTSTSRLVRGDETQLQPVLLTVAIGTLLVESLMSFPMFQMQTEMMAGLLFARYLNVSKLLSPAKIQVSSPRLTQAGVVVAVVLLCSAPVLDAISSELIFGTRTIPLVWRLARNPKTYVDTMSILATIRSQDPLNRFEMATIYRSSFDQQKDPAAKRTLAIAAALEYKAGLALNPFHQGARGYFADFLERNPWLTKLKAIHTTPTELYRKGIEIYPVYLEPYLKYAAYLRRQGENDKAYNLLAHRALPWADLHYSGYYYPRIQLFRTLLPEAKRRGDKATLEKILSFMQDPIASHPVTLHS